MRPLPSAIVLLILARAVSAADAGTVEKIEPRPIAVMQNGVSPGEWTMDFDAAREFAASNDIPIFVNFSGSDWCQYCKKVEREVFALPDWRMFASNRFVLVNVDLPRAPSAIPAALRERNEALQQAFEVQGFPTFLVLETNGRTVLKRFGLAKELNATNFIREAASALRRRPADVRRFVSTMGRLQAAAYTNLLGRLDEVEKEAQAWLQTKPERNAETMRKLQEYVSRNTAINGALDDIEIEKLVIDLSGDGNEKALAQLRRVRELTAVLAELRAAQSDLESWLLGRPADTPANRQRLAELLKRLADLQEKAAK